MHTHTKETKYRKKFTCEPRVIARFAALAKRKKVSKNALLKLCFLLSADKLQHSDLFALAILNEFAAQIQELRQELGGLYGRD
ncbi:hypothetical protein NHP190002_05510 [Helicobacter ailurogastricus]|uniref:hypothetical protein n=1 Tax=Helicobacter ailurogastricus TaxID=1578720 RepID=UPI00244D8A8D|nr:hypothetical protein [Helicobacter ailurogastricus]GMB89872.1 hypothetical protein NHP190002_05510 [Helicobacter ailurogastricus]